MRFTIAITDHAIAQASKKSQIWRNKQPNSDTKIKLQYPIRMNSITYWNHDSRQNSKHIFQISMSIIELQYCWIWAETVSSNPNDVGNFNSEAKWCFAQKCPKHKGIKNCWKFYMKNRNQYKPKNFHQKVPTVPQIMAFTRAITNPILNRSGRSM